MRLRVLFFGLLKELIGVPERQVEVQDGATVAELLSFLRSQTSKFQDQRSGLWDSLAVAVNREYASPAAVLHEGDEVALLPPVSGGLGEACELRLLMG